MLCQVINYINININLTIHLILNPHPIHALECKVRVPLNTIAMGITVVRDDCDAQVWTDATKEALVMVRMFSRAYRVLSLTVYFKF